MKLIKLSNVNGSVEARPSKSLMQRAVAAALLAEGTSRIENPSFCDDSLAALGIAKKLGAKINKTSKKVEITGIDIKENLTSEKLRLDCQESGLCMRMFSPIAALFDKEIIITGKGSLLSRPVNMIEKPLTLLGAKCLTKNGFPPMEIKGPIKGGNIGVDGSISSQFLTGLLMALPLCENNSKITVSNLKSKPYIRMTLDVLDHFGIKVNADKSLREIQVDGNQKYKPCEFEIENDWSGAAFLLVAGAIAGRVELKGLNLDSEQADRSILAALKCAGALLEIKKNSVVVEKNNLQAFEFDISNCPDLFPALVVLACNCKGTSRIMGIERLKHKESNRAFILAQELKKMGAKINVFENHAEIKQSGMHFAKADSHNDHRIAMACSIAGLTSENGARIIGEKCVSKSYPEFFDDLKKIGADVL